MSRVHPRRFLIVAIHDQSWGRTAIALAMAESLRDAGAAVSLVVHEMNAPLLQGRTYPVTEISTALGPLAAIALQEALTESAADTVILCDYFSTCNLLHRVGLPDLDFLFDRPVIALDVWDSARTGLRIDRAHGRYTSMCLLESQRCCDRFLHSCRRVAAVPIASPTGDTARMRVASPIQPPRAPRVRHAPGRQRTILTTTAAFQHRAGADEATCRLQQAVPSVIATAIARLGPGVRWVHVGPAPFTTVGTLGARYEWLGQIAPSQLDSLIRECDLVLSLNASASTTFRALAYAVPVVLAINSPRHPALPAFRLWPLGYYDFLGPLIEGNPYFTAIHAVDVHDVKAFTDTCGRLLFSRGMREASADAQRAYLTQLESVPTPAEVIDVLS